MKYVIFMEIKEPVEENLKRMFEIEGEREKKGETFGAQKELIANYYLLSEYKAFMIVDVEDVSRIAKWVAAYSPVMQYKISPIMTREEYEEATK